MYICVFLCNYFMIFSPDDLMKISNLTQRLMLASLFLWCLNLTQFNLNFWRFAVGFAWRITTWYLKPFPAVRTYMKYYMVVLRKKKKKKKKKKMMQDMRKLRVHVTVRIDFCTPVVGNVCHDPATHFCGPPFWQIHNYTYCSCHASWIHCLL